MQVQTMEEKMTIKEEETKPTYLGDGLYVSHDGWQVELFAHDGIGKTNMVFLEPKVLERFLAWVKENIGEAKK
jgi:hypothetical protein